MRCCFVVVAALLYLPGSLVQDTDGLSLELASVVNSVQSHLNTNSYMFDVEQVSSLILLLNRGYCLKFIAYSETFIACPINHLILP